MAIFSTILKFDKYIKENILFLFFIKYYYFEFFQI